MPQLRLDESQVKAVLAAIDTQRNVLKDAEVGTETERKRLDVELEWLQDRIKMSTGVTESGIGELL